MNADPDGAPTPAADEWLSRRSQEAEQAVDVAFDLSACVREPIHLLGGVQSYGTLLAAEVASGTVVTAADNTARLLGVEARELVGGPVLRVLGAPDWEEAVALSAEGEGAVLSLPVTAGAGPSPGPSTCRCTGATACWSWSSNRARPTRPPPATSTRASGARW